MTNLITLDGMSHFPKEFLDLKAYHSNKAQIINDTDTSQEDIEQTAHGAKDQSLNNRNTAAVPNSLSAVNRDTGLLDMGDNRLINSRPSLARPTDQLFSNQNLIRLGSEPMPNFGREPMRGDAQNLLARVQSEQERKEQNEENEEMPRMRTAFPGGQARANSPDSREENMLE